MLEISTQYRDIEGIIAKQSFEVGKRPRFKIDETPFEGLIPIRDAVLMQIGPEKQYYNLWLEKAYTMLTVPAELLEPGQLVIVRERLEGRRVLPHILLDPIIEQINNLKKYINRCIVV